MRKRTFFKMLAAGLLAPLTKWSVSKASTGPTVTITGDATEWINALGRETRFLIATIDIRKDDVALLVRKHRIDGTSQILDYGTVGAHLNHTSARVAHAIEVAQVACLTKADGLSPDLILVDCAYRTKQVLPQCYRQRLTKHYPVWACRARESMHSPHPNYRVRYESLVDKIPQPIIEYHAFNYETPDVDTACSDSRMAPYQLAHYREDRAHEHMCGEYVEQMQAMGAELLSECELYPDTGRVHWKPDEWAKYNHRFDSPVLGVS